MMDELELGGEMKGRCAGGEKKEEMEREVGRGEEEEVHVGEEGRGQGRNSSMNASSPTQL